jgi:hypothetical protein
MYEFVLNFTVNVGEILCSGMWSAYTLANCSGDKFADYDHTKYSKHYYCDLLPQELVD